MPRYKIDIADIVYGYPSSQPVFSDEKRPERDFIYVTAPNGFVAEVKAEEIFNKNKKKYLAIIKKIK